jgi:preprotein translocase subunit YajC
MNPKDAILKIRALFEDMPQEPEQKVEMAEYSLADGTKVMISALEVGGEVKLEDGSAAPDGEHELADGQKIVTEGGLIKEIKQAEEPSVEVEIEAGKDKKIEEMAAEFQAKLDILAEENQILKNKLAEIEKKSVQGFSQVIELIEELTKVPQADPIEKPSFKFESSKDIKFERLNRYRNAILNNKN